MTTRTLSEAGQKLADALRQARVLHSWNHVSTAALNTAATLLFTPPEGEGAGLREALELVGGYLGTVRECCPAGPGSWHLMRAQAVVKAALASPQPAVQGPVAAGVGEPECGECDNGRLFCTRSKHCVDRQATTWKEALSQVATLTSPADPKTPDAGVDLREVYARVFNDFTSEKRGNALWADISKFRDYHEGCEAKYAYRFADTLLAALAQPAPAGEDETGVREALAERLDRLAKDAWIGSVEEWTHQAVLAMHAASKFLVAPQPPKAETPAGVEALRSLSDAAAPGEWSVSGVRRRVDEASCVIIDAPSCPVLFALPTGAGAQALETLRDAKFAVAAVNFVRAALSTAPAARPGDGFVLVPREPTEEMQIAGHKVRTQHVDRRGLYAGTDEIWSAMIAAAPAADGGRG